MKRNEKSTYKPSNALHRIERKTKLMNIYINEGC
jgi:hypothetical protein